MQKAEFYFSLPRLLAQWSGHEVERTERNWPEANLVGILVHLVAYAQAFQVLLLRSPVRQQLLWSIPLAFLVWLLWLIVLYLNSLLLKLLRALRLTRDMPDRTGQSLLILLMITIFAWRLVLAESWLGLIGGVWLAAVALNLLAALLLIFTHGAHTPAQ